MKGRMGYQRWRGALVKGAWARKGRGLVRQ